MDVCILRRIFMPAWAVGFACVAKAWIYVNTTTMILGLGDRLKVIWIYAKPIATKVIKLETI
jgi:hypothetical protein